MFENEVVTDNVTETNSDLNVASELSRKEKNKKGKVKFFIIGALIIIAVAVGLYIGYKKLNNDPMSIYKDSINNVYKSLNNALKENKNNSLDSIDITKDPVVINLDAKFDSSMSELKNFSGLNYSLETGLDYTNKKLNVGASIKDSSSPILSFILSVIDKNIYLKSEELYSKVLDLGEEDIFGNLDINSYFQVNGNDAKFDYDNYSYILKEFKMILIDSLDKNKLSMTNENITINNKEYKAKKATYNLDKENMERTLKFFQSRILKDEKLIKALAESVGVTTDTLKEGLNEEIDMSSYEDIKVNLYTDNLNNLIAGSFVGSDTEVIKFDCAKDELNIEANIDNVILKISQDKEDNIEFIASENNVEVIKMTFKEIDKENVKIDYRFNIDGLVIDGNILVKDFKTTKDSMSFDMKLIFNTSFANKPIDFTIDGSFRIAKTDVKTLDNVGSVKIDNISETEAMEIFTKLSSALERFGLSDLISSIM